MDGSFRVSSCVMPVGIAECWALSVGPGERVIIARKAGSVIVRNIGVRLDPGVESNVKGRIEDMALD